MNKKLTKPVERCPFCGDEFSGANVSETWYCMRKDHTFYGPFPDQYGRGIDKLVRQMRARILKEARNV